MCIVNNKISLKDIYSFIYLFSGIILMQTSLQYDSL